MDVFFVLIKVDGPITGSGLITGADQGAYKYKWQFTVFFIQVGQTDVSYTGDNAYSKG